MTATDARLARKQELDAGCTGSIPKTCPASFGPMLSEGEAFANASTATDLSSGGAALPAAAGAKAAAASSANRGSARSDS